MRGIEGDLEAATAASAGGDWGAALEAVRMIQGRAVVARQALEGMLGSHTDIGLPPLVRAVQAVGRTISQREVDSLPADELRVRMHAVLEALDRELRAFLEPPEEAPFPADRDRDAPVDGVSDADPDSASGWRGSTRSRSRYGPATFPPMPFEKA